MQHMNQIGIIYQTIYSLRYSLWLQMRKSHLAIMDVAFSIWIYNYSLQYVRHISCIIIVYEIGFLSRFWKMFSAITWWWGHWLWTNLIFTLLYFVLDYSKIFYNNNVYILYLIDIRHHVLSQYFYSIINFKCMATVSFIWILCAINKQSNWSFSSFNLFMMMMRNLSCVFQMESKT